MVFVNSKKFACESCIKGHRSSSCSHTDRPLFEIKKKGRPVSQCERCRELRQSRRVHSKCTCNPAGDDASAQTPAPGSKARRFIPIAPALPNGLRDVVHARASTHDTPSDSRQRVDTLLNPCTCGSVWGCRCRMTGSSRSQDGSLDTGLSTLARAAAMCCNVDTNADTDVNSTTTSPPVGSSMSLAKKTVATAKRQSRPSSPNHIEHKRHKHHPSHSSTPGPSLPPIISTSAPVTVPEFSIMPPMSAMTLLAGSGCTCGLRCACPGCVEHRGDQNASKHRADCADGACATCIDHVAGPVLPEHASTSTNSILDQFFARAAALPAPPVARRMTTGVLFDPMDVKVYPAAAHGDARGASFGLVALPKLECCGGACGCPNGQCGCGKACDGCCDVHIAPGAESTAAAGSSAHLVPQVPLLRDSLQRSPPPEVRSCCAGEVSA